MPGPLISGNAVRNRSRGPARPAMQDTKSSNQHPRSSPEHGLTPEEYQRLLGHPGPRAPSLTELGIFSVMWSEHCSYKSSRRVAQDTTHPRAPQVDPRVPGENAGVVDIGDGDAVHLQDGEPQTTPPTSSPTRAHAHRRRRVSCATCSPMGAAARGQSQCACAFGDPAHPKTRSTCWRGGGSRQSAATATATGSAHRRRTRTNFRFRLQRQQSWSTPCAFGLARKDKIFYSAAKGVGLPVVYVGSKTGRERHPRRPPWLSAEFDDASAEKASDRARSATPFQPRSC